MHVRQRVPDRPANLEIRAPGEIGMDAALQADLGRAALPGFVRAPHDFVQAQYIRRTAQRFTGLAFRERAELALVLAQVGVIDIAVDHIADAVAATRFAQFVRRGA